MKNNDNEQSLLDLNSGKHLSKAKQKNLLHLVWNFIEKWFSINLPSTATLSMTKRNFQRFVNFVKILNSNIQNEN